MENSSEYIEREDMVIPAAGILDILDEVRNKGGCFRFTAQGYSMTPAIRHGDKIEISPLMEREIRVGDIVLFRKGSVPRVVVHRVIRREKGRILTRGDNSAEDDGWIPSGSVQGMLTGVERGGRPVRMIQSVAIPPLNGIKFLFFQLYLVFRKGAVSAVRKLRER